MDVPQELTDVEKLVCKFSGKESTVVHYTETTGSGENQQTHHRTARGSHKLVEIEQALEKFVGGFVPVKHFSLPFSIELPDGLPPSMQIDSGCVVGYTLKFQLKRPGMFKTDVKLVAIIPIQAVAGAYLGAEPVFDGPREEPVNLCCCIPRGSMTLAGVADKNTLNINDQLTVGFLCHNNSSSEIQHYKVQFNQVLCAASFEPILRHHVIGPAPNPIYRASEQVAKWKAEGHSDSNHVEVCKVILESRPDERAYSDREIMDLLADISRIPSVPNNIAHIKWQARGQRIDVPCYLADQCRPTVFTIAGHGLFPSYSGSLITVQHYASVVAKTGMCITDPAVGNSPSKPLPCPARRSGCLVTARRHGDQVKMKIAVCGAANGASSAAAAGQVSGAATSQTAAAAAAGVAGAAKSFCSNCGTKASGDGAFCKECGTRLGAVDSGH